MRDKRRKAEPAKPVEVTYTLRDLTQSTGALAQLTRVSEKLARRLSYRIAMNLKAIKEALKELDAQRRGLLEDLEIPDGADDKSPWALEHPEAWKAWEDGIKDLLEEEETFSFREIVIPPEGSDVPASIFVEFGDWVKVEGEDGAPWTPSRAGDDDAGEDEDEREKGDDPAGGEAAETAPAAA